jgi:hypothetical protein
MKYGQTTILIALLLLAGCNEKKNDERARQTDPDVPAAVATDEPVVVNFGNDQAPYTITVPSAWSSETPANATRRLQFRVPRVKGDAEDAELVVSFRSTLEMRTPTKVDDIVAYWAKQFGGSEALKVTRRLKVQSPYSPEATVAEYEGVFTAMTMEGSAAPKPGRKMLGAIFDEWGGYTCVKLIGPRATVEANRKHFDKAVESYSGAWGSLAQ